MSIENKARMDEILQGIGNPVIPAVVASVEKKKTSRKPAAPFTTSTLQQEAARKLYFSSKRTMSAAQKLYEQGLITYMRTDATNLSQDALAEIREFIDKEYGEKFLPKAPNVYATKSKNAQEAHEAIRPTHFIGANENSPAGGDEAKLYDLIWKRTIACQMTNAEFDSVAVDIEPLATRNSQITTIFHAVGTTQTFAGFLKVYQEGTDDAGTNDNSPEKETKLPPLAVGDAVDITKLLSEQHFTMPPPRYTEASLVKKLEELGIGRPSTYASIMSTIVDRAYVEQDKSRRFTPTPGGWVIADYLSKYFADLIAVDFTAKTEEEMDDVSNGEKKKQAVLKNFWNPIEKQIDLAKEVKTSEIIDQLNESMREHLFPPAGGESPKATGGVCPKCGGKLGLKLSRYGAFIGCGNYPTCDYTQRLGTTVVGANENSPADSSASDSGANSHSPLQSAQSQSAELGEDIKFLIGRFGPYVQQGSGKDAKRASAKKYTAETITLEAAKELLSGEKKKAEAVVLGENPATGKEILYYADGRYGAYISSNKVNVSVKEQPDLATAADLINNKKPSAKKAWGKK
jgi:DNA topoisomerase-1